MAEAQKIELSAVSELDEIEAGKAISFFVMVHIKAPLFVTDERKSRAPISVSAVLDRSGSMSGTKLALVKKTMEFVIQNFKEDDRLGVVAYDDSIIEPFQITTMAEADRKRAVSSVTAVSVGGCTNLSGGLFAGIDQIRLGKINVSDYNSRGDSSTAAASPMQRLRRGYMGTMNNNNAPNALVNSTPVSAPSAPAAPSSPSFYQSFKSFFAKKFSGSSAVLQQQQQSQDQDEVQVQVQQQILQTQQAPIQQQQVQVQVQQQMLQTQQAPILQQQQIVQQQMVTDTDVDSIGQAPVQAQIIGASAPCPLIIQQQTVDSTVVGPVPVTTGGSSSSSSTTTSSTGTSSSSSTSSTNISSVWLFTDGLANEGIQDITMLKAETQRRLAQMSAACSVFTFGFGGDHDSNMLRGISESGNGMYYYIETEDKIPDAFADCLGGLVSVAAQNLRLTATPQNAYKIVKIQTAFKNVIDASTGVGSVQMPDIYSEESRDIIFEVEAPAVSSPHPELRSAVAFTLQYFNVLTCAQEEVTGAFDLRRPERVTASPKPMPVELDKQRNRILCMEALSEGRTVGERDLAEARKILKKAIERIEASISASDPYCQSLISDLKECLEKMVDTHTYESCGHQLTSAYMGSHGVQRSCASRSGTYATSSKKAMAAQSKAFFS